MVTDAQQPEAKPKPKRKPRAKAAAKPKAEVKARQKPAQAPAHKPRRKPTQKTVPNQKPRPASRQTVTFTQPMLDPRARVLSQLAQLTILDLICFFGARRNARQDGMDWVAGNALALLWTAWPIILSGAFLILATLNGTNETIFKRTLACIGVFAAVTTYYAFNGSSGPETALRMHMLKVPMIMTIPGLISLAIILSGLATNKSNRA